MNKVTIVTEKPRKERKENADRRRRQILDATFRSIVANGLSKTTLSTVAKEAGLSQGVAVFYFENKAGLLTAALKDLYVKYETCWSTRLDAAGQDPVDRLRAIVEADFDPEIFNRDTLSVWFAFWGEQQVTPHYAEIIGHYDQRRDDAMYEICLSLAEGKVELARNAAEWIDTLTDGFWQKVHLFGNLYDGQKSVDLTFAMIRELFPDHAPRFAAA